MRGKELKDKSFKFAVRIVNLCKYLCANVNKGMLKRVQHDNGVFFN